MPDLALIVALGGGRVIDTAKAVAGARPRGPRVAAIPTTLSAAEMTRIHRLPKDVSGASWRPPRDRRQRPRAVRVAAAVGARGERGEQPRARRRGAAHDAGEPRPLARRRRGRRLTAAAYALKEPDRDALALAALLSGYAIDANHYGLHHVLSQTLVRVGGAGHGPANAAMLPHTTAALERRGDVPAGAADLARDLARRAGTERLRDLGVERPALDACADAAVQRSADLERTPPAADRDEIRALYEAAW